MIDTPIDFTLFDDHFSETEKQPCVTKPTPVPATLALLPSPYTVVADQAPFPCSSPHEVCWTIGYMSLDGVRKLEVYKGTRKYCEIRVAWAKGEGDFS